LNTPSNPETSTSAIPTAAQLSETRQKQWHQQGEALLTIENLHSWINTAGLVLFAPRPQIASPAPSLAEAVLGAPNATPTIEQTDEARSLLARLVAEGLAVPLNLLGAGAGTVHASAPGDTPDFVASTAVFSYVFTLRGDKAWKQPPTTSGAFKVSPLALATHEALSRRGPLSAYDLTTELGKEVTEAAVLRALGELWTHLRVLPLAQPDGAATLWELTGARFNKQIKAGANAGQPSALSALISLYLGQAVVASEDEIESFLSPLASRSRIRDVIHALLSARQLETIAIEGRTMLHVAGSLPSFLTPQLAIVDGESQAVVVDGEIAVEAGASADADSTAEGAPRITKFIAKPRKIGTGYLAKAKPSQFGSSAKPGPFERGARPAFGAKTAFKTGFGGGFKSGFKARAGSAPAPDRERRPFNKPASGFDKTDGIDKSASFDKPWEEEKRRRLAAIARPSAVPSEAQENVGDLTASSSAQDAAASTQPREPRAYKPRTEGSGERRGFGSKPAFGRKPSFGGKPSFGDKPRFGSKPAFGSKPRFGDKPSFGSDSRPPRRDFAPRGDFAPRTEGQSSDARPPRKTFSKPGTFGRKRESFSARPAFGSDSRPPRRDFAPRSDRGPSQRPDHDDRPAFGSPRAPGSYAPRGGSSYAPRPQGDRPAGRPFAGKPREASDRGFTGDSGKRVYRKFDAPRDRPARPFSSDRPARPFSSNRPARSEGSGGSAARPSGEFAPRKFAAKPGGFAGKKPFSKSSGKPGGFAGKKPFGKSRPPFTGKPGSTFAKFAENKKPFGNRPPARKFKPKGDESV
jgi:hypothetical protein